MHRRQLILSGLATAAGASSLGGCATAPANPNYPIASDQTAQAYTFDELPHTGEHDGLHYAMGYCGSGVSLSLYYGMKAGQKILGRAEGVTALDGLRFQTRPLYHGKPWFLTPSVAWYRLMDRFFS